VDRLPERQDGRRRAEGGLRLQGRLQSPAPGVPLVSYVTVVRNAVTTLPRTLASVKAQRGAAVEHIVVDGLSSDGTLRVIEAHAGQIDYFVSEPDSGLYDALNKAVSLARGSLVCVLNADDWLTADAAATAARALLRVEPDVGLGAGRAATAPLDAGPSGCRLVAEVPRHLPQRRLRHARSLPRHWPL
jgi:glycosyltransferase involved in cell wall biosynthesis